MSLPAPPIIDITSFGATAQQAIQGANLLTAATKADLYELQNSEGINSFYMVKAVDLVEPYQAQVSSSGKLRSLVAVIGVGVIVLLVVVSVTDARDKRRRPNTDFAKELGVIVTAHCENETLIAERQKELLAAGKTDPGQHHESRPPAVEAEGVHHLMTFAELTGAATYIVHLSCREALAQAIAARQRGVRVSVETLIQYLTLDKTYAEKPGFEGAKYVMSPPLRDKSNQPVLWNGLRDGLVQTVATDHCPFDFKKQKVMGKDDFTKIPNGIPSLEDRINVLYTYGVKAGKIDLHTFVNVASTQAAKTFDLFPRKGTIQPGADADLVVFDPNYRGKISAKTHHVNVDYNVFEGWKIEGRPSVVTVRGQVAVRDGRFVGKLGHGKFLQRKPSHF